MRLIFKKIFFHLLIAMLLIQNINLTAVALTDYHVYKFGSTQISLSAKNPSSGAVITGQTLIAQGGMSVNEIGNSVIAYYPSCSINGYYIGLVVADITNPSAAIVLQQDYSFACDIIAPATVISGSYLYVADVGSVNAGVNVIKINADGKLSATSTVGSTVSLEKRNIHVNGGIRSLRVCGDYLFAQNSNSMYVYYIGSGFESSPELRATHIWGNGVKFWNVKSTTTNKFKIYALTDKNSTSILDVIEIDTQAGNSTSEYSTVPLEAAMGWPGYGSYSAQGSLTDEWSRTMEFSNNNNLLIMHYGSTNYNPRTIVLNISSATPTVLACYESDEKTDNNYLLFAINNSDIFEIAANGVASFYNYGADGRRTFLDSNALNLSASCSSARVVGEKVYVSYMSATSVTIVVEDVTEYGIKVNSFTMIDSEGKNVLDLGSAVGVVTASANVSIVGEADTVSLVLAFYDNNRLIKLDTDGKLVATSEQLSVSLNLNEINVDDISSINVKAMLFSFKTLKPLAESLPKPPVESSIYTINKTLYDTVQKQNVTVDFELWVPNVNKTLRGIYIVSRHGFGSELYKNQALKNTLAELDCALLSFYNTSELRLFPNAATDTAFVLDALTEFAPLTGHPEVQYAPIGTWGHSNGARMASIFAKTIPERIFAVTAYKSDGYSLIMDELVPVPFQIIVGETDLAYGYAGQYEYLKGMRGKNALTHYVVDPGRGHGAETGESVSIVLPFIKKAFNARVPKGVYATNGMLTLNTFTINDVRAGWLGDVGVVKEDQKTWTPGNLVIYPYVDFYKNTGMLVKNAVWLFDQEYAKQWQEFERTGIVQGIPYN